MKIKSLFITAGYIICSGFFANASTKGPSSKMTCQDFLTLDEVARPKIVYWFDGYDRKGNPEEYIDFDQNERLVPTLVEECTKNPAAPLAKKVKAVQKKTASN